MQGRRKEQCMYPLRGALDCRIYERSEVSASVQRGEIAKRSMAAIDDRTRTLGRRPYYSVQGPAVTRAGAEGATAMGQ